MANHIKLIDSAVAPRFMPPPAPRSDYPAPLLTGNLTISANDENSSMHSTERVCAASSHDPSCDPDRDNEVDAGEDLPTPIFLNAFHFQGPSQPDAVAQKNSYYSNMEVPHPSHTPFQMQPHLPHYELHLLFHEESTKMYSQVCGILATLVRHLFILINPYRKKI